MRTKPARAPALPGPAQVGIGLLMVAATLFAYAPALRGTWLWDDATELLANPQLRRGDSLGAIWRGLGAQDYFPLKTSVQWLEWHLWQDQVLGYHLASVGLHLASALLLWRVLGKLGVALAWLGGLLFALHPLAVESVAWMAELKNTLSLPLLLLAFGAWIDFAAEGRRQDYLRALACFVASLLAKSSGVMFPGVLLLYLAWKRGRIERRAALATVPFFAVALVLGLVTIHFQATRAMAHAPAPLVAWPDRIVLAGPVAIEYLGRALFPVRLLPIYPPERLLESPAGGGRRLARPSGRPLVRLGAPRDVGPRRPVRAWGVLPQPGPRPGSRPHGVPADRPGLGSPGLPRARLPSRAPGGRSGPAPRRRRTPLVLEPGRACPRAGVGGHPAVRPPCSPARRPYGPTPSRATPAPGWPTTTCRSSTRRPAAWMKRSRRAGRPWPLAAPGFAEARSNLGLALTEAHQWPEAIEQLQAAVRLDPDLAGAHLNLGRALFLAGAAGGGLGEFAAVLRLDPGMTEVRRDLATVHNNLANAEARAGRLPEALAEFEVALGWNPANAGTHRNYGYALHQAGRNAAALAQFDEADRLERSR